MEAGNCWPSILPSFLIFVYFWLVAVAVSVTGSPTIQWDPLLSSIHRPPLLPLAGNIFTLPLPLKVLLAVLSVLFGSDSTPALDFGRDDRHDIVYPVTRACATRERSDNCI